MLSIACNRFIFPHTVKKSEGRWCLEWIPSLWFQNWHPCNFLCRSLCQDDFPQNFTFAFTAERVQEVPQSWYPEDILPRILGTSNYILVARLAFHGIRSWGISGLSWLDSIALDLLPTRAGYTLFLDKVGTALSRPKGEQHTSALSRAWRTLVKDATVSPNVPPASCEPVSSLIIWVSEVILSSVFLCWVWIEVWHIVPGKNRRISPADKHMPGSTAGEDRTVSIKALCG